MLVNGLAKVFILLEDDNTYSVCFRREINDELRVCTIDAGITDAEEAQRVMRAYILGKHDGIAECVDNSKFKKTFIKSFF